MCYQLNLDALGKIHWPVSSRGGWKIGSGSFEVPFCVWIRGKILELNDGPNVCPEKSHLCFAHVKWP